VSDPFDIMLLDPIDVSLFRSKGGVLLAKIKGETYSEITLHQTFPFTKPRKYISIWNKNDYEIGVIRDLYELDEVSRYELNQELRLRYIIPIVTHVSAIKEEPGLWIFQLKTDRGPLQLYMRNIHEHVQSKNGERIIITDMDGKRCEIPDVNLLDQHSKKELQKII
jgi:Domain of unknown function (DUF1854)